MVLDRSSRLLAGLWSGLKYLRPGLNLNIKAIYFVSQALAYDWLGLGLSPDKAQQSSIISLNGARFSSMMGLVSSFR